MTAAIETESKPKRPMTAAEKRKIDLQARKEAIAERKKQNLIKIYEEKEAKIRKIESFHCNPGEDAKVRAQRIKELAA